MRLIPGRTKVKVELFRGVRIADVIIGAIFGGLLVLLFTSNLPAKLYISIGLLLIAAALLVRMDNEPNYIYLLHILRHFSYRRRYIRLFTDEDLARMNEEGSVNVSFEKLFENERADVGKENSRERRRAEKPSGRQTIRF